MTASKVHMHVALLLHAVPGCIAARGHQVTSPGRRTFPPEEAQELRMRLEKVSVNLGCLVKPLDQAASSQGGPCTVRVQPASQSEKSDDGSLASNANSRPAVGMETRLHLQSVCCMIAAKPQRIGAVHEVPHPSLLSGHPVIRCLQLYTGQRA